jgi:hypothetical protein
VQVRKVNDPRYELRGTDICELFLYNCCEPCKPFVNGWPLCLWTLSCKCLTSVPVHDGYQVHVPATVYPDEACQSIAGGVTRHHVAGLC